jgi:hypothetical protein
MVYLMHHLGLVCHVNDCVYYHTALVIGHLGRVQWQNMIYSRFPNIATQSSIPQESNGIERLTIFRVYYATADWFLS